MAIENGDQLKEAVNQSGGLVPEISDYLAVHPEKEWHGRVRFPRGFLKTNAEIRTRLPFIEDDTLKRNVSYALMTFQTLYWVVFRTDISGQAREMLILPPRRRLRKYIDLSRHPWARPGQELLETNGPPA